MDELISRQAAIRWVKTECNPYGKPTLDFESGKKVIDHLEQMPPAQPEIIRCKDCKYWHKEIYNGIEYLYFSSCDLNHHGDGHNFYCADAESRINE